LLDAAWKLIAERGLDVRMADIAAAANVTRQSVYVHFMSRGGLLIQLVRRADEREGVHQRFALALAIEDPSERLLGFLDVWFDFAPKIHPVARQLIAARTQDPEANEAWTDRMEELRQGFLLLTQSLRRDRALGSEWTAPAAADYLWAASSIPAWEALAIDCGWGPQKTRRVLERSLAAAVLC
jgi:AcrR family transcriptional regulator